MFVCVRVGHLKYYTHTHTRTQSEPYVICMQLNGARMYEYVFIYEGLRRLRTHTHIACSLTNAAHTHRHSAQSNCKKP